MADTLRRLINNETCRILQEKLESWYRDYYVSGKKSPATILIREWSFEKQVYGGRWIQTFKWILETSSDFPGKPVTKDAGFQRQEGGKETTWLVATESLEKDRLLRELSSVRSFEVEQLEKELSATRLQLSLVQQDLTETKLSLEDTKSKSATTLLAAEDEIVQLKTELARSRSPSPSPARNFSPSRGRLTYALRHARLVERFNDIYSQERLNAQTLLRSYTDDLEMVQRIIYTAVVESFYAAKKAFRQFKMRVRKTLTLSYSGPEPLEDTVMDYIIRQEDLYDVQASVSEVIRALNISPKISLPGVDFIIISSLIRELCRIAFSMQTLDPPLDVSFGTDGELFSEYK
ncbi:Mitochondria-eating protein, partial [Ophiophagus hannah]